MALNKIIYKNRTLIDLTNTTAVESDVFSGKVFHKADGTTAIGIGGGSLKLCLKNTAGDSSQVIIGDVGFVVNP